MLAILLTMLAILLLAGVIVLYVAFPHRDEAVPGLPWVGRLMRKSVKAVPTIDRH